MLMHNKQINVTWKYLKAVQAELSVGVLVSQCIFHEGLKEKPQRTKSIETVAVFHSSGEVSLPHSILTQLSLTYEIMEQFIKPLY